MAFQPSELVKIVVIIALAKYFSESDREHLELHELFIGGLIAFLPMMLVILQGDLGTAITFIPIYAALSIMGRDEAQTYPDLSAGRGHRGPGGLDDAEGLPEETDTDRLQPLQRSRAMSDTRRSSRRSRSAPAGSWVRDSGRVPKASWAFCPARHTDFVFAAWSEERGFAGSAAVLGLFLLVRSGC